VTEQSFGDMVVLGNLNRKPQKMPVQALGATHSSSVESEEGESEGSSGQEMANIRRRKEI